MTIKHLILCGGGPSIFRSIGALYFLEDSGFWNINNIETIYATSAGAIFGAMLCLKFDHETIEDYLVKRPWHEAFPIKVGQIMDIYNKKGLYDHNVAEVIFKPLLNAKDLPLTITLKELYEYSKIELHMYSLEVNSFKIEDLSYKTHPDLLLLDGLIMTSAIPTIFVPFCKDDKCYVDGGVIANYPVSYCLDDCHKKEEMLGIRFSYVKDISELNNDNDDNTSENNNGKIKETCCKEEIISKQDKKIINKESNILDFLMDIFGKIIGKVTTEHTQEKIPYEISCKTSYMTLGTLKSALYHSNTRKELIESGRRKGKEFFQELPPKIELNK
jgi:predicted acylesterase/phospholipase RssA